MANTRWMTNQCTDTPADDWQHARLFTCIFYLNTMKEESGGRTEFLSGRKVLPKAGKLLIFPATWSNIHCGSWVKDEHKYICTIGVYVNV